MKRAKCLCGLFVITIWTGVSFASGMDYGSLPDLKAPDRKKTGIIRREPESSETTSADNSRFRNTR